MNFAEGKNLRKGFKDRKQDVKLGYYAKINSRSIIIGPEYVAIIGPLCRIKSLLSYRFERRGTYVDKSTISISIECSRLSPIKIVPV